MFRCNTIYEGEYLLGTSIARPLIAKRQIEIAKTEKLILYRMVQQEKEMIKLDLNFLIMPLTLKSKLLLLGESGIYHLAQSF